MNSLPNANRVSLPILLLTGLLAAATARGQITLSTQLLDFGSCTGDTILRTFLITNIGGAGADVTLNEPDEPFVILEDEAIVSVGVLETRSVTVGYVGRAGANPSPDDSSRIEISFRTNDSEPVTGSLTLKLQARCPDGGTRNGNDSIYFSLQVLDFGNVVVGRSSTGTISIDNGSSAGATISVGALSPPYSVGSGTVTVGPGGSHEIDVVVNPTTTGTYNTWLPIVYRSGDNAPDTVRVVIRATATNGSGGDGVLMTNRSIVDFGTTRLNTAVDQSITLRNVDMSNTVDVRGNVSGLINGPFMIVSGGGSFDLAPGETHTVIVRFLPTVRGNFSDSVVVGFQTFVNGASTGNGRTAIGLLGDGRAGSEGDITLVFSDTEILFNDGNAVNVGGSAQETVQISNPGAVPVEIRFVGPNQPFSNVSGSDPITIAPGATRTVVVGFSPTLSGSYVGTLGVIYGPAGNQSVQNITLLGLAADPTTSVSRSVAVMSATLDPLVPNPVHETSRITISTERSAVVTITLHTALGERIATLLDRRIGPGTQTLELNVSTLESGIYFCTMTVEGRTQTRTVTVLR